MDQAPFDAVTRAPRRSARLRPVPSWRATSSSRGSIRVRCERAAVSCLIQPAFARGPVGESDPSTGAA
eukprot:11162906-Lingulodinium_polyedra.AAC.1